MAESSTPYWVLISVLTSTQPLTKTLAFILHQAAFDLYRRDASEGKVSGDLITGTVRNLKQDALLGTIGGPVFEAEVETERGSGMVRFLLTRQGLELMSRGEDGAPPKKPKYLN